MRSYEYQRVASSRLAATAMHTSYDEALVDIQRAFVDAVGEGLFDYIKTLHKRIGSRKPWSEISGLQSWDYGSVRSSAKNLHEIRVYQKDISVYPGDVDPVIEVSVEFLSPSIGVLARAGGAKLHLKQHKLDTSPSQVALQIGAGWEKLLTGSVDYGD
jgi:hypothetical protein